MYSVGTELVDRMASFTCRERNSWTGCTSREGGTGIRQRVAGGEVGREGGNEFRSHGRRHTVILTTYLHQQLVRDNNRFRDILNNNSSLTEYRLSFLGMRDDDLELLVAECRSSDTVESIDLSFNRIQDGGVQKLVAALAQKAFPKLKALRIYKNEFTGLGRTVLEGLKFIRKDVVVEVEPPEYMRTAEEVGGRGEESS